MGEPAKSEKDHELSIADEIKSILKKMIGLDDKINSLKKQKLLHAIEIGKLLIEQNEECEHGEFLNWLKENFAKQLSQRTAYNYMDLAKHENEIANFANLTQAMDHIVELTLVQKRH